MYAETRLAFSSLQRFPPEFHHHPLQSDEGCFLLRSSAWTTDHRPSPERSLFQATPLSEYDLGEDGDVFTAPELLTGNDPLMELDPAAFSLDAIDSISDDHLLNDVFCDCDDLLADTRLEDAFPGLSDPVLPSSLSVDNDGSPEKVRAEPAADDEGCEVLGDAKNPELKVEEQGTQSDQAAADGPLQKSVSSGCLASMDWINGADGQIKPSFLGIPGMDLGAVFGMRRAYSEGDIQTLMTHMNVSLIHPPFERLISLGDPKMEDRMQKLSRYRKKKTKRNFDRKIKYACRKALADSQPRIRGRFAKTEEGEVGTASKSPCREM